MAKLSLNKHFIRDSLDVLKTRGLKALIFGTIAIKTVDEHMTIQEIANIFQKTKAYGAKTGSLTKLDPVHKGIGNVYLVPNGSTTKLVFTDETKITNGPDLWVYLSESKDPKNNLGSYVDLGLIKGNKGGQIYVIEKPISKLADYCSVIIYCKQFEVLFTYALLK